MIPSTGTCYTMCQLEPGLYEYVIGPCEELADRASAAIIR